MLCVLNHPKGGKLLDERKKDAKKRLLRDGERQRKDGRYEYRYTDLQGEPRSIYSWRLVESDPLPRGKRPCTPLRNLEKEILEQQTLGLDVHKASTMTRSIPMFGDVKQVLLDLRDSARFRCQGRKLDDEFVFVTRSGSMLVPSYGSVITRYIREAYNKRETARAEKEDRDPVLLPQFTPHSLRHTFCTRLCEQGMNIKVVQYVMGHEDIATTMNIYNEATGNFVNEEFVKYDGAIRVC